jgi:hypothetical protein
LKRWVTFLYVRKSDVVTGGQKKENLVVPRQRRILVAYTLCKLNAASAEVWR